MQCVVAGQQRLEVHLRQEHQQQGLKRCKA
jgi:hypothetical protein